MSLKAFAPFGRMLSCPVCSAEVPDHALRVHVSMHPTCLGCKTKFISDFALTIHRATACLVDKQAWRANRGVAVKRPRGRQIAAYKGNLNVHSYSKTISKRSKNDAPRSDSDALSDDDDGGEKEENSRNPGESFGDKTSSPDGTTTSPAESTGRTEVGHGDTAVSSDVIIGVPPASESSYKESKRQAERDRRGEVAALLKALHGEVYGTKRMTQDYDTRRSVSCNRLLRDAVNCVNTLLAHEQRLLSAKRTQKEKRAALYQRARERGFDLSTFDAEVVTREESSFVEEPTSATLDWVSPVIVSVAGASTGRPTSTYSERSSSEQSVSTAESSSAISKSHVVGGNTDWIIDASPAKSAAARLKAEEGRREEAISPTTSSSVLPNANLFPIYTMVDNSQESGLICKDSSISSEGPPIVPSIDAQWSGTIKNQDCIVPSNDEAANSDEDVDVVDVDDEVSSWADLSTSVVYPSTSDTRRSSTSSPSISNLDANVLDANVLDVDPSHDANDPSHDANDPSHDANDPSHDANDPSHDANDPSHDANDPSHDANDPSHDANDPSHETDEMDELLVDVEDAYYEGLKDADMSDGEVSIDCAETISDTD